MPTEWRCTKFEELTPYEIYALLQLRIDVFIIEQTCLFQDADNKDQKAWHLTCRDEEGLLACSRLLPAGASYDEISIGRIVTARRARRLGLGRELLHRSIAACFSLFGEQVIRIGAQLYLKQFYESFGFVQASPVYLEDGIEHIEMLRQVTLVQPIS